MVYSSVRIAKVVHCDNTLCSTCLPLKFKSTNVACEPRLREEITQLRGENEKLKSKGN